MSNQVIDRPSIIDAAPKFFTDDNEEIGNDNSFPAAVVMINLGGGKYAAINLTTSDPVDPMTVNFLVCFATEDEASLWEIAHFTGDKVTKEFQEARDIAVSKENIHGLALMQNSTAVNIHWVR